MYAFNLPTDECVCAMLLLWLSICKLKLLSKYLILMKSASNKAKLPFEHLKASTDAVFRIRVQVKASGNTALYSGPELIRMWTSPLNTSQPLIRHVLNLITGQHLAIDYKFQFK
ncbi:hypothetical protein EGR_01842 [Echinococcus granulosus]|uniref:Uncharacterized protein n=1 Tax=Echinococcus granulosus TaxID=6210 RepID=W6URN5_ECHGR|nr:hypothetical protein EGR_01842 [Echinococcus granulosus]EUB63351.1 hypothetical protein EGR_01842 [Echinococcus granulosus]